jgi:hypothetical protein
VGWRVYGCWTILAKDNLLLRGGEKKPKRSYEVIDMTVFDEGSIV